jgi:tetratricopeptide (TPR) repeat protein
MHIDETQESLLEKQHLLLQVLNQYPTFREGIIQLATTWLQLKRDKEALEVLKTYHQISDRDPTVEYYLAALHAERANYPAAWKHLRQAEKLTTLRNHTPQALKELEHELRKLSPE